jgi:PKD repeat protein
MKISKLFTKLLIVLVIVISKPAFAQLQANFTCDTIQCDTVNHWCTIQFTDASTGGPVAAWYYDLANGVTTVIPNPQAWYLYGVYTICLKVYSITFNDSSEICCQLNVNTDSTRCDCNPPTGVANAIAPPVHFQFFPNPSHATLIIIFNKKGNVSITNLFGEVVLKKRFLSDTNGKMELDVSFLAPGIYFIETNDGSPGGYRYRKKFLKE